MDQPNGSGAPDAPHGAPSGVTEERVAEIVNRAIGARNKAFEAQISKQLDTSIKGLQENFKTLTDQLASNSSGGDGGKKKKDGSPGDDDSNTLKLLQRKISDLEAENQRVQQTAAAERAKSRDQALRSKLTEALSEFGVKDPIRIKHAIHHLVDGDKRIGYRDTDDDTIVYRDNDDTILDLPSGLKAWTKSEDGKHFLPPTGARGSGDGRGGSAPAPNGQPDQSAFWAGVADAVLR